MDWNILGKPLKKHFYIDICQNCGGGAGESIVKKKQS